MVDRLVSAKSDSGKLPDVVNAYLTEKVIPGPADIGRLGAERGTPDAAAAFTEAAKLAKASAAFLPNREISDPLAHVVIDVPAGVYTITTLEGLIGKEGMTSKAFGLRVRGQGIGVTTVIFDPTTPGALIKNDYWLAMAFEGISFVAAKSDLTFMQSYTTHNAQRYSFERCEFRGFKYGIDLQGDNNNSEFLFLYCHTSGMQNDGAFLYIAAENTSDQFLNYWFVGCTHWSTSAAFIDAARGGHFHIYGLDASDWGGASTSGNKKYLFALRGTNHALGVTQFHATGVRVENKSVEAALLYSEWPHGNVEVQADWSSQQDAFPSAVIIDVKFVNTDGAIYKFHDSWLAGQVRVTYAGNDWQHGHSITFEDTHWSGKLTPSEVVTYTRPSENRSDPQVTFTRCRGNNLDVFSTSGYAVWDATIGYAAGNLVHALQKRSLLVHSPAGNTYTPGGQNRVALPIGALITGLRTVSPQGAVSEGNGGSWTLRTSEATPATIATVNVAGSRADGYNVATELAVPFLCSTRTKATVDLLAVDVDQTAFGSMVMVDGYW